MLGVQRLGNDPQRGALFYVFAIGFKHSFTLISGPNRLSGTLIQEACTPCAAGRYEPSGQGCAGSIQKKLFSKFYAARRLMRVGETGTPCVANGLWRKTVLVTL
ncbi:hypothetical protein GCM10007363_23890 [Pseudomonas fluvialis]|uniref:Uncharacterized protein n=1 Tax=Pseudomonas fluvialis TaxID=1793966 RepID=A0ABQ2AT01_9PSED|nr:hypothetical protein GCM10007363_23890 [Pseudomonas fluvialis]